MSRERNKNLILVDNFKSGFQKLLKKRHWTDGELCLCVFLKTSKFSLGICYCNFFRCNSIAKVIFCFCDSNCHGRIFPRGLDWKVFFF